MKTLQASTLAILNKQYSNLNFLEKIYFYKQYVGVYDTPTNNQIRLLGDYSSEILSGDNILFPTIDFVNEFIVDTCTYYGGYTTITFLTITSIDSSYISHFIAKRIDVSYRQVKDSITNSEQNIEGSYLTDFDSGSMSILFDNSDGFFYK
jgi:hypothetical protein